MAQFVARVTPRLTQVRFGCAEQQAIPGNVSARDDSLLAYKPSVSGEGAVLGALDADPDLARHAKPGQPVLCRDRLDHAVAPPRQALCEADDDESDPFGEQFVGRVRDLGLCGGSIARRNFGSFEPPEGQPRPEYRNKCLRGEARHPARIAQAQRLTSAGHLG